MRKLLALLAALVVGPAWAETTFPPGVLKGFVNGENAGMICNDTVDDGPAFQAALNLSVNRTLLLPLNASCRIKSYVSWPSNVHVVGQNTQINFDAAATGGGPMSVTMDMLNVSNITIEGVTFNGPGTATVNKTPRFVANVVSKLRISRSVFQNFGDTTNSTTITATYAHGFLAFYPTDVVVESSLFQNNTGDGLSFSNSPLRTRVLNNTFFNNYDSAIVPCTIGGSDNQAIGNSVTGSSASSPPLIVLDRCQHNIIAFNTITGASGASCIRIARYVDTADINQDNKIVGNSCYGGTAISVEASGTTQGAQSVPKGGLFSVSNNTIVAPSGAGIRIADSVSGVVDGNRIVGAGAEGIVEVAYSGASGNNQYRNNIVDGATFCLRSLISGGSLGASFWSNNTTSNCSTATSSFANNGSTDGAATAFTPTVSNGGTLPTATVNTSSYRRNDKSYTVTYVYAVTAIGAAPNGFYTFTLPNGITAGQSSACSVFDKNTGLNTGLTSYVNSGASTATINITSLSAHTYVATCNVDAS